MSKTDLFLFLCATVSPALSYTNHIRILHLMSPLLFLLFLNLWFYFQGKNKLGGIQGLFLTAFRMEFRNMCIMPKIQTKLTSHAEHLRYPLYISLTILCPLQNELLRIILYNFLFLTFCLFGGFVATPGDAQVLLLVLHSGFTSGGSW